MRILFRLVALGLGLLAAFVIVEIGLRAAGMGFGNSPMEPDPAAIIARAFPSLFPGWSKITSRSVQAAYGPEPAR